MRFAPGDPLSITLGFVQGETPFPVGRLAMQDRRAQLEWSDQVLRARLAVSPILYPQEPGLHAAQGTEFGGLHGFLSDSLPEGWGAILMRRRLQKMGVRFDELDALERLALVGDRGRGALVFHPSTTPPHDVDALDLDALAEESIMLIEGGDALLGDTLADLAGASGGARPKIHVGFDDSSGACVSESVSKPGYEPWIVKFRAPTDPIDIGPIEQAYAAMARQAGLEVSPSMLLPSKNGPGYFVTKRFDRPGPGRRLHLLSLAGAIEAPPQIPSSYDNFLKATWFITRRADDVAAAFRRMVFNILVCNRDDHTRQHSYLMDADGDWTLAPAYDLTYAPGPGGEHYLDVEGEGREPTQAHVLSLGRRHGIADKAIAQMIDNVRASVIDWPAHAATVGVTISTQEIASHLENIWKRFV